MGFKEISRALGPLLFSSKSVSFSQYGEDLLLGVTLLPTRVGRYVDVGAYHPWRASNTYKLYLRGWCGATVEPNPDAAASFRRTRPRDIHVVSGVALRAVELNYYRFLDAKLNTFSESQAQTCRKNGFPILDEVRIPCRPLQDILDEHRIDAVDLLSVDCEGYDLAALQSLDFSRVRPTSIIVEDYDAFEKMKNGAGPSPIEDLLRRRSYAPVGQAMYSTLYIDLVALKERKNAAFRLPEVQFA
jgi:FkbM family methyltransferase